MTSFRSIVAGGTNNQGRDRAQGSRTSGNRWDLGYWPSRQGV